MDVRKWMAGISGVETQEFFVSMGKGERGDVETQKRGRGI
jgi:hypothetical protein